MTIDLIRHGEPVGGRRYRGQTDDPLSEQGWSQTWRAVGDYHAWQLIVTSPLIRCAEFADALGSRLSVPVRRDARLIECGFGAWEGKTPEQICAGDPGRLLRFRHDPVANAPEGAEPLELFRARVEAAWAALLESRPCEQVLVVAHAGVIRMILASVLGLATPQAYRLGVGHAALTRIRVEWDDDILLPTLLFHDGRL